MTVVPNHDRFDPPQQADLQVDIAIVGAGVSGAYSAWRLQQHLPDRKIALFEYSDRIGGRLYSKVLPGMPHIHAELGGMRFIPATHKLVTGLIDQLELPTRDFPMGAPPPVGDSNNLRYLRRTHLRVSDLDDADKLPYTLNWSERGMDPDALQTYVMNSLVPDAQKLTDQDWYSVTVLDGRPLYTLGLWNLLYQVLSSEAYAFMLDAGGYDTNVANSNAVSGLPVDEFGPSVVYRTLVHGYQQLPLTLVEQYTRDLGGQCLANWRLDSLGHLDDGRYALTFVLTETIDERTQDKVPTEVRTVQADHVILAMPRRSLELVRWPPLVEDQWLRRHVPSVIRQAAFKLFLGYAYPWWRPLGLVAGRSITDMPIRQMYYFQTEGEQEGADPQNHNSLMMASYNDLRSVPFWKALEEDQPYNGHDNPFLADGQASVPPHRFMVTQAMILAAQSQLKEIHNLYYLPEPYTAMYHDWTDEPFGAGWHAWKAGFKYWEIMPRMRKPLESENVYICGEAYSNNQGWVEGALQTAELMLEEHFGLKRPDWLPRDYDLGP